MSSAPLTLIADTCSLSAAVMRNPQTSSANGRSTGLAAVDSLESQMEAVEFQRSWSDKDLWIFL
jgi:hypothetical protein